MQQEARQRVASAATALNMSSGALHSTGQTSGSGDVTAALTGVSGTGSVGSLIPQAPPEVVIGLALVEAGDHTDEGRIILAVTPAWRRILTELESDSNALSRLDWRQTEELIAGAYREDGWTVTLTPRSGDKGRDVIAHRDDVGAIRILDQVKQYKPDHLVDAGEVREMFGVLTLDQF